MSWAPRDRVIGEITANPARSDRALAAAAGCDRGRIARVRRELEASGRIPRTVPADRTERPRPSQPRRARDRAVRVLIGNAWRSDVLLAREARTSVTTVCEARHELEADGAIPVVPPDRREHRPQPPRPSRSRRAIVLGARTPREVANAAGVTRGQGWKALKVERNRPKMPPPPLPPKQCEQCGRMFVPSRRQHASKPQRFCSKTCNERAHTIRRRAGKPPPDLRMRPTVIPWR